MGLLSDPKTREKIVGIISRHNNKLAFLCYVSGVAYFLALAHRPLNAGVYISENALIPGLVEADFLDDNGAGGFYQEYRDHVKRLKEEVERVPERGRDDSVLYEIPAAWLTSKFRSLGLEAYTHNYSFHYPASILNGQELSGQNVYAILRAPRASGTEALVLSVPFRPPGTELEKTAAGLALLLGVAKGFRKQTYWAKDIVFLVTDNEEIGMQAWLSAYHHDHIHHIAPGELEGRSGAIQAAINLEFATDQVHLIDLKLEGVNGQLPNLDLVNTVVRLCRKEGIPNSLHNRMDTHTPFTFEGWQHSVGTMLHMMWSQAAGCPSANHALFHRYRIEAVTLHGTKVKGVNSARAAGFFQTAKVVEGVFRSLNNLLERFHQSFFFYLLPSTDRYVSIGLYFPPFALMAAPLLVKAIAMWIAYAYSEGDSTGVVGVAKLSENSGKSSEKEGEQPATPPTPAADTKADQHPNGDTKAPERGPMSAILPHLMLAVIFGVGTCHAPTFFVTSAASLRMTAGQGLGMGVVALHLSAAMYPFIINKKAAKRATGVSAGGATSGAAVVTPGADWRLLKCVALLALGLLAFATALMNISLAFFLTLLSVPPVTIAAPSHNRFARLARACALLLISPLSLLFLAALGNQLVTSPLVTPVTAEALSGALLGAWEGVQVALLQGVVRAHLLGAWTFQLASLAYWPCWLLFWAVLWLKPT